MTLEQFETYLKGKDVVLVDFWAEWCGPCKVMSPLFEDFAKEESVELLKVNVDDDIEIAKKYNILSIPTMEFFAKGKEAARFVGVTSKKNLKYGLDDTKGWVE
jgi:thioredoxin 1